MHENAEKLEYTRTVRGGGGVSYGKIDGSRIYITPVDENFAIRCPRYRAVDAENNAAIGTKSATRANTDIASPIYN